MTVKMYTIVMSVVCTFGRVLTRECTSQSIPVRYNYTGSIVKFYSFYTPPYTGHRMPAIYMGHRMPAIYIGHRWPIMILVASALPEVL